MVFQEATIESESDMHDLTLTDQIFHLLNREIWIVTAADAGRRGGLVATWVSPASIDADRPVLLAGIAPNHFTCELIDAGGGFGAHLITKSQIDLAWRFAIGSGRDRDKLSGLAIQAADSGSPILQDCLAWLDCRVISRLDTGDRVYFWGEVIGSGRTGAGHPLCEQELFKAATDEQLGQLRTGMHHDIAVQRPLREAWLDSMPKFLNPLRQSS